MKRLLVLVVLTVLGFAVLTPRAEAREGGTERPLKGSGSSTQINDISTFTNTVGTSTGTANLSHLGQSTINRTFTATLTSEGTSSIEGTATLVAANGDVVFGSLTGTGAVPLPGVVSHVVTITGGTGRFSDASGSITLTGRATIVSFVYPTLTTHQIFTVQGSISY